MRKYLGLGLAFVAGAALMAPPATTGASAAPISYTPPAVADGTAVTKVQRRAYRRGFRRGYRRGFRRGHRRFGGRFVRVAPLYYGPRYYRGRGVGGCRWLRRRAVVSGNPYWWRRYRRCVRFY